VRERDGERKEECGTKETKNGGSCFSLNFLSEFDMPREMSNSKNIVGYFLRVMEYL
jgi:hypothetical protein